LFSSDTTNTLATVPAVTENPQIQVLKDTISGVQAFFKNTFKAPILTPGLTTGGKTFPCRGPNCLGIFQAKGTSSSFDPFTGVRLATAGSTQFQNITGSNFGANQTLISQGNKLKSDVSDIILNLQNELNILQTNSV